MECKWISVKDELPEIGEYVLGYNKNYGQEYALCYRFNDSDIGWSIGGWSGGPSSNVKERLPTHWMKLTKPEE